MATRIAISDTMAAQKCLDAGLTVEQTNSILNTGFSPAKGYYYPEDINKYIKQMQHFK